MTRPEVPRWQVAALLVMIVVISAGVAYANSRIASPAPGIEIEGANWTLQFLATPGGAGAPPPLWDPNGSCMTLSGWFPADSNITCAFTWTQEHCTPLGGSSAACSVLVGVVVDPPFTGIASFPTEEYCPSDGCMWMDLTFHGPPSAAPETLSGTLLLQAASHT
jgi:hypothetical protein